MVEEDTFSFRIRASVASKLSLVALKLPPIQACSELLSKTPNRPDCGLLGETYAHFKVHLYSSDFIYINLHGI